MKKKYKVVRLHTKDVTNLFYDNPKRELFTSENLQTGNSINSSVDGQHLYLISEEEIKVGDYIPMYDEHSNKLVSFEKWDGNCGLPSTKLKVGATSDKSLILPDIIEPNEMFNTYLPQIPQEFIKEYCNNPVEEVYLEVNIHSEIDDNPKYDEIELKLTQNNEVIISPVEEKTYSREDMLDFAWWLSHSMGKYSSDYNAHFEGKYLDEWKSKQ